MPCSVPSQLTVQPRRFHFIGHGQAGHDVAAGAGRHDDEVT
jgi:hypothetical protein